MRHKIDRAFEHLADGLGTNMTIVCFTIIAFVPLAFQRPHTILEWQNYLSQTVIQLIALAILQKGTRTEGKRLFRLIEDTHRIMIAEFKRECFSCKNHKGVK